MLLEHHPASKQLLQQSAISGAANASASVNRRQGVATSARRRVGQFFYSADHNPLHHIPGQHDQSELAVWLAYRKGCIWQLPVLRNKLLDRHYFPAAEVKLHRSAGRLGRPQTTYNHSQWMSRNVGRRPSRAIRHCRTGATRHIRCHFAPSSIPGGTQG